MQIEFGRRVGMIALVLVLLVGLGSTAYAQRLTGDIRGTVTDAQGAVVADAKVTVTNPATGVSQTTQTSSIGTYNFPSLLVASYDITVEKGGFKKSIRRGVTVATNASVQVDAKLEPGAADVVVEVTAESDLIQTTSSDLINTFSTRTVIDLPSTGGILGLSTLVPNTTTQGGGVLGSGGSVGGTRPRLNSFSIDGTDNNDISVTGPVQPVIDDAVAEFSLITNQFSAEYGQAGGGQFNLVTKSGTNNPHGEFHWFTNNRRLNATDNLVGNAIETGEIDGKPRFDSNRVGGSVGGPIFKDKLFFFGAYEYNTAGAEATGVELDAPTGAGLATLQALAATPEVLDILNQFPAAQAAGSESECVGGSSPGREDNTDPVITNCVANGGDVVPIGSIQLFAPDFFAQHDFITNADWNTGRHQVIGRFLYNRFRSPVIADTPLPQFTSSAVIDNRKVIIGDTWLISNRWVNNFRFAYTRQVANFPVPSAFTDFPNASVNTVGINIGPSGNLPQSGISNIYQFSDSMSYSRGSHTFKWGAEYHNWIAPSDFLPRARGEWDYSNLTELVQDAIPDGLNGALRGAGSGFFAGNQQGYFFFFQDDWKILPRLTLNLGLRYEVVTVSRDSNLQAINSIADCPTCVPFGGGTPNVFIFGKPKKDSNNISPRVGFAWDPTGSGKWAVRGGAGVYFDKEPQNFPLLQLPPQLQTEQRPDITCTLDPTRGYCPGGATPGFNFLASGGLLSTNVPCATTQECQSSTGGLILDEVKPKTITWTLSVQRELFKNTSLELRYLGTSGISLPVQVQLNIQTGFTAGLVGLPTFLNASEMPATVVPATVPTRGPWVNFVSCASAISPLINSGPFCTGGFDGSVITSFPKNGHSTYHSGSVDLVHRFDHGLYLRGNYTWAHNIDNATNELFSSRVNPRRAQDGKNLSADRGRSVLDIRHKFALSWIYDVPKINTDSGFGKAFLHGWQINGTWLVQTGQPVTALSGTDSNGNFDSAGDRAIVNAAGDPSLGSGVNFACFDGAGATFISTTGAAGCGGSAFVFGYVAKDPTAGFVQAGLGATSTAGRNSVSTEGLNTVNLSIFKNTRVSEGSHMQFRLEMFNFLNHRNFTLANGGVFGISGNALSTTFSNVTAGAQFLNEKQFSGGNRTITLGLKFIF